MNSAIIQLLVLGAIALFLILRLKSVLGTRDGFERPAFPTAPEKPGKQVQHHEPGATTPAEDRDITDHVPAGSPAATALGAMKQVEPDFNVGDFLRGARGAYEMILMAFQKGELDSVRPFLGQEVAESFDEIIRSRQSQGLTIDATFVGIRELRLEDATFDANTRQAEMKIRLTGEFISVVHDANGKVVEGDATEIRRQKDVWVFARQMGSADPNWQLVETGE